LSTPFYVTKEIGGKGISPKEKQEKHFQELFEEI